MKFIYTLLIITLLLFAGCKQDFQTTVSKYVDTPVVYGLLNMYETYPLGPNQHYIRIQKGYLVKGNAYLATGIEDSIYYPNNLTVTLASSDGAYTYNLTQVDGATQGLNKDTGIFANTPNYLYTFNGNLTLDSAVSYNLFVTRNNGADTVATASTYLVSGLSIFYPANNNGIPTYLALSNTPGQEPTISWSTGSNSGIYDLTISFVCNEYLTSTNAFTQSDTVNIPVFSSYIPTSVTNNNATYTLPASIITNYLANHLTNNPLIYREFVSMQFNLAAGGTSLVNYFNTQQSQSGLTSSNALPTYTNITGGVGLLSSREYQSVSGILLSNEGLDSLSCTPSITFLHFKGSTGNVCN